MEWFVGGVIIVWILVKLGGSGKRSEKPTDMVDLYTEMENKRIQGQNDKKSLETAAKVGAGVAAGTYGFKKGYELGKKLV